jgi:hypothetical protein
MLTGPEPNRLRFTSRLAVMDGKAWLLGAIGDKCCNSYGSALSSINEIMRPALPGAMPKSTCSRGNSSHSVECSVSAQVGHPGVLSLDLRQFPCCGPSQIYVIFYPGRGAQAGDVGGLAVPLSKLAAENKREYHCAEPNPGDGAVRVVVRLSGDVAVRIDRGRDVEGDPLGG